MRRPDVRGSGTRLDRMRRRFGLDRNDLRRPIDLRQRRAGLLLIVLFLLTAAPVSAWVARHVYETGERSQRHEFTTRHQVTGTVLGGGSSKTVSRVNLVRVGWTERDGSRHEAKTTVLGNTRTGARHRIWVNASGQPSSAPRSDTRVIGDTLSAGAGATTGIGAIFLLVHRLLRRRFDRRCYRLWDTAWAELNTRRIT
ncbi:hypothetical protein ACGFNU_47580 [Spirillospora sp. NPDC048911]|uniref:Rv1733c family protein n=1 Tax=Spirillospora sp. NPDC048911 TaxID=3364527 RepID=UPI0037122A49